MADDRDDTSRPGRPSYDLTGKRVVVVGGKVGIGLGIAQAAYGAGATVTVASRRSASPEALPELAPFTQLELDISDEAAVRATFQQIGGLDHLVVAAGPTVESSGTFMDPDMRGVRSCIGAKFLGSWACARHAVDHLAADGSITFLTGGSAARSKVGLTAITSTYSAVEALARSLALELGPIRVNTLRPGFIDTSMWAFLSETEVAALRDRVRERFPTRRLGTPADVGHAAVFLMTNPYVTGAAIEITGGENLVDWLF